MLDLLDDPRSELVDLFLTGRELFLAVFCQSVQLVAGTVRQSMAVLLSSMSVSLVSSLVLVDILLSVSHILPIVFTLPLSPFLLSFL